VSAFSFLKGTSCLYPFWFFGARFHSFHILFEFHACSPFGYSSIMGGGPLEGKHVQSFSSSDLATGWSFRQTDSKSASWLPVSKIPSTVHQDLIDHGM
jgi:hypothetical protein